LNSAVEFDVVREIWLRNPHFTGYDHEDFIHVGLLERTEDNFFTDSGKTFHTFLPTSKAYFIFSILAGGCQM
jgi:hypothetical protein